jgi:hypothetical protein
MPAPGDKRGQVAELTQAGYERLLELAPGHARVVKTTMFDPLTPAQLANFQDICTTILQAMADRGITSDCPPAPPC